MLHLLLLFTAFALVSVPLRHLTGGVKAGEAEVGKGEAAVVEGTEEHPEGEHAHRVPVTIRLRFAHQPEALSLRVGEMDLLKGVDRAESSVECVAELELGHEGNEFVLEGKWPEGASDTAVTVELEPDGMDARTETRWSDGGTISDVLTFAW